MWRLIIILCLCGACGLGPTEQTTTTRPIDPSSEIITEPTVADGLGNFNLRIEGYDFAGTIVTWNGQRVPDAEVTAYKQGSEIRLHAQWPGTQTLLSPRWKIRQVDNTSTSFPSELLMMDKTDAVPHRIFARKLLQIEYQNRCQPVAGSVLNHSLYPETLQNRTQTLRAQVTTLCLSETLEVEAFPLRQVAMLPYGTPPFVDNHVVVGGVHFETLNRAGEWIRHNEFDFSGTLSLAITEFLHGMSPHNIKNWVDQGGELKAYRYLQNGSWQDVNLAFDGEISGNENVSIPAASPPQLWTKDAQNQWSLATNNDSITADPACSALLSQLKGNLGICLPEVSHWASDIVFAIPPMASEASNITFTINNDDNNSDSNAWLIVNGQDPQTIRFGEAITLSLPSETLANGLIVASNYQPQVSNLLSDGSDANASIRLEGTGTFDESLRGTLVNLENRFLEGRVLQLQLPTLLSPEQITADLENGIRVGASDEAQYRWFFRKVGQPDFINIDRDNRAGEYETHTLSIEEMRSNFTEPGWYEIQLRSTLSADTQGVPADWPEIIEGITVRVEPGEVATALPPLQCTEFELEGSQIEKPAADETVSEDGLEPEQPLRIAEINLHLPLPLKMRFLRSRPNGAFNWQHIPSGACPFLDLQIEDPARPYASQWTPLFSCNSLGTYSIQPAEQGTLTGVVRDNESSVPIPGAVVAVNHPLQIIDEEGNPQYRRFWMGSQRQTTDAQGRFAFEAVPSQPIELLIQGPEDQSQIYLYEASSPFTVADQAAVEQTLTLVTRTVSLISNVQTPFLADLTLSHDRNDNSVHLRTIPLVEFDLGGTSLPSELPSITETGQLFLTHNETRTNLPWPTDGVVDLVLPLSPGTNRIRLDYQVGNETASTPEYRVTGAFEHGSIYGFLVQELDQSETIPDAEITMQGPHYRQTTKPGGDGWFRLPYLPTNQPLEMIVGPPGSATRHQVEFFQDGQSRNLGRFAIASTATGLNLSSEVSGTDEEFAVGWEVREPVFELNRLSNALLNVSGFDVASTELHIQVLNLTTGGSLFSTAPEVQIRSDLLVGNGSSEGISTFLPPGVNLVQVYHGSFRGMRISSQQRIEVPATPNASIDISGVPARDSVYILLKFDGIDDYSDTHLYLWHNGRWADRSVAMNNVYRNQIMLNVPTIEPGTQSIQAFLEVPAVSAITETGIITEGLSTFTASKRIVVTTSELIPVFSPSRVNFSDEDSAPGFIEGTVEMTQALDITAIQHYTLFLAALEQRSELESFDNSQFNLLCALESYDVFADSLTYKFAPGTTLTSPITHLVAFSGNSNGFNPQGPSLLIADQGQGLPQFAAQALGFTDEDPVEGSISGIVNISRAIDESSITNYLLYWGTPNEDGLIDQSDKADPNPIAFVGRTGTSLAYELEPIDIPEGATHLLVFTFNSFGEMETGIDLEITDLKGG